MAKKKYIINLIAVGNTETHDLHYAPDIDINEVGEDFEVRHFNLNNLTCKIYIDEEKNIRSQRKEEINDTIWNDSSVVG